MDHYSALYPVMAFILAVVIGRMVTMIMDRIRTDHTTTDMDCHHELHTSHY